MAKLFKLEIVSAEESLFTGEASKLFVTAALGEMEVLYGHAPLLTTLNPGPVWIAKADSKEEALVVLGGIMEVQPTITTILADAAIRAADIDQAAVLASKQAAEDLINKKDSFDYSSANQQLVVAVAQLRVLKRIQKKLR